MKPIPYGRQDIQQSDINAVIDVLNSEFLTQGQKLKNLKMLFQNILVVNMLLQFQMALPPFI